MNKLIKIFLILSIMRLFACSYNTENSKGQQRQALMYLVQNSISGITNASPNQAACISAVITLNMCIGQGYGFNPSIMCSSAAVARTYNVTDSSGNTTTQSFSSSDYDTLRNCAQTVMATTACNLNQYKAPNAQVALNTFATCQKNSIMIATVF